MFVVQYQSLQKEEWFDDPSFEQCEDVERAKEAFKVVCNLNANC